MNVEEIQPYDMLFNDSFLVTSISYSYRRVSIEGIPARGRSKQQILQDEGFWYGENFQ